MNLSVRQGAFGLEDLFRALASLEGIAPEELHAEEPVAERPQRPLVVGKRVGLNRSIERRVDGEHSQCPHVLVKQRSEEERERGPVPMDRAGPTSTRAVVKQECFDGVLDLHGEPPEM